jgi:DNA-binding NtrC family response regulator
MFSADMPTHVRATIAELEKQRILEALEKFAGNQTRAAEALGISRRTLINRLDEYGIARPRKRDE